MTRKPPRRVSPQARPERSLLDVLRPSEPLGLSDEKIDRLFAREPCDVPKAVGRAAPRAPTKSWQMQDAKNRLSELVRKAESEGPQAVTVRGRRAVVVVAAREYDSMQETLNPSPTLSEVMEACPYPEAFDFLDESRSDEPMRHVDL